MINTNESLMPDGSIYVKELGHFDFVIYEYYKRPLDSTHFNDFISCIIAEKGKNWLSKELEIWNNVKLDDEDDNSNKTISYWDDHRGSGLDYLCSKIRELESIIHGICNSNPLSIDLPQWKNNLKTARRRLRNLIEQNENFTEVSNENRELVNDIIGSSNIDDMDPYDYEEIEKRLWGDGDIEILRDYWRRKSLNIMLIIPSNRPDGFFDIYKEITNTFYFGLYRATISLCRSMLERVVRYTWKMACQLNGTHSIGSESFEHLINAIPDYIIINDEKSDAHFVRKKANEGLHDSDSIVLESDAITVMLKTFRLCEALLSNIDKKEL